MHIIKPVETKIRGFEFNKKELANEWRLVTKSYVIYELRLPSMDHFGIIDKNKEICWVETQTK